VPALIRKLHQASIQGDSQVVLWGTGKPMREFLFSDDMAEACVFLANLSESRFATLVRSSTEPPLINIGCGEDLTIREVAEAVAEVVGYRGSFVFDTSKPDGTPRKLLDVSKLRQLGWVPQYDLLTGLKVAYESFLRESGEQTPVSTIATNS